jgi:spermidine synthase
MVLELAAVRLLAPWFGTSLVVWTNVIAVILLALATGYFLGGRLASHASPLFILGWMLLIAGVVVAWLPHFGAALARSLLPEEIALQDAAGLVGWGSLAIAVVAFLPPATLLGTVCPLTVEGLARARGLSPGRAGGLVLFVSTLGSLAGVFGTSHLMLPMMGLQRTFLVVSFLLLLAGGLAMFLARRFRSERFAMLIILPISMSSTLVFPSRPDLRTGVVELASRESPYQTLRVVEDRTTANPLRFLQINEGFDSFQSVWQEQPGLLPPGFYYNDFLLPLFWSEVRAPWNVLVLGLGAGTVARVFEGEGVEAHMVGVEIDPTVVELGRAFFDLPTDSQVLSVWSGLDARVALRVAKQPFDQIILDCYANQVEIPHHLCTLEFFQAVREHLVEGGWLTANLGGFDFKDPVVASVASTCARAFDSAVLLLRVPWSRNYLLLARRNRPLPLTDGCLNAETRKTPFALGPRRLPGFARLIEPDGAFDALTDDWCPIERLQFESLMEARALRRNAIGS